MNDFYVYAWLRPDGEPFYIGKGRGDRDVTNKGRNIIFRRIVSKLAEAGALPSVVRLAERLDEPSAFALEVETIARHGRLNNKTGILANMTDGGEGSGGARWSHTLDSRRRMSEAKSGIPVKEETKEKLRQANVGKRHTAEARAKISAAGALRGSKRRLEKARILALSPPVEKTQGNLGRKHTEQARANMSAGRIGTKLSEQHRETLSHKKRLAQPRSGFKGVSFQTSRNKWCASITLGGKSVSLGRFDFAEDAARAYDQAAHRAWGEHCYLNFPDELCGASAA